MKGMKIEDSRTPEQSEWSTKSRFQLAKELDNNEGYEN